MNVEQLNEALLKANWDQVFQSNKGNIDTAYDKWLAVFRSIVGSSIPHKNVVIRPNDNSWMNGSVRRAMRKRDRLLKQYSRNKPALCWEKYRLQRNLVVSLIRKAKSQYDKNINETLLDPTLSPKKWWYIVKYNSLNKMFAIFNVK